MPVSMYSMSIPIFLRMLNNMSGWIDTAEEHAKAHNFDPDNYLGLRLTPDMFPFIRQIQVATEFAGKSVARLAGDEPPEWSDDEATLGDLRKRIASVIEYVESVPAERIDGSEEREILWPISPDRTFTFVGEPFLREFVLPNFYFHSTMAYALLRQGGLKIGKMDYLGSI